MAVVALCPAGDGRGLMSERVSDEHASSSVFSSELAHYKM